MARSTSPHLCQSCGQEAPRWQGQCPGCGEWNTMVEATTVKRDESNGRSAGKPVALASVESMPLKRHQTGIAEFDRVIGGGIVPGSLVLIGGSPGIGKSTLTTMALANMTVGGRKTLYVSGEESVAQARMRAERISQAALEIPVVTETDLDVVLATLEAERPEVCVIDSIQTLRSDSFAGTAGSVTQVREAAAELMRVAKQRSIAVILVGHVTKEGALAGPRVLEHAVDCVLQFEGDRDRSYRVLRALKNRFGSVSEAGVFEMRSDGLVEVADASARFVDGAVTAPGSVVLAAIEGSRPLLVEVQALVSPSELPQPRRVVNGIDRNRLALVLAVLARHVGIAVGGADVFVNVVGGVRADEPGADLAIALAVASAYRGVPLRADDPQLPLACFGEVGLTGELRPVAHAERRLSEADRFGLRPVIVPSGSGAAATEVESLTEAIKQALPDQRDNVTEDTFLTEWQTSSA